MVRAILSLGFLLHTAVSIAGAAEPRAERPNVLLILTDDQGYGDLGCHGNTRIRTPRLDRLAEESVELTRFYVSPVCAPTRSSLLTGRYSLRCGVWGVTKARENMHADEVTLAEVFKRAGYATGCFGKWHNGEFFPMDANGQGFDEHFGFCGGQWNWYFDPTLERNSQPIETKGYITDLLTDAAIKFIGDHRDRPFLCYVPYNAPHSPYFVDDRYRQPYLAQGLAEPLVSIYGMIECVDENIARLLATLDDLDLSKETIVVFLCDNGPATVRYTAGLRGKKGNLTEGGVRSPFFIRYPGVLPQGKKIDTIAAHIDVLPTLAELCGINELETLPLDGVSLAPLLLGDGVEWPDRMLFGHREGGANADDPTAGSVRTQRYNLVAAGSRNQWELFDMESDPGEQKDLSSELPDVAARLRRAYDQWYRSLESDRIFPRRAVPLGHDEEKVVYLRPPEAIDSHGLKFFGGEGYRHHWFTGWTSADCFVEYDLDVATAGEYELTLAYRTPKDDTGAVVQVSAAGHSLRATLDEGVVPVPQGNFRETVGTNVPTLDWPTAPLGRLRLNRGVTRLRLQAVQMPGKSVMDFNHIRVTRVE